MPSLYSACLESVSPDGTPGKADPALHETVWDHDFRVVCRHDDAGEDVTIEDRETGKHYRARVSWEASGPPPIPSCAG